MYVFWLTAGIRSDRADPIWSLVVMASRSAAKPLHAATSRLNSLFSLSEACRHVRLFSRPNGHVLDLMTVPQWIAVPNCQSAKGPSLLRSLMAFPIRKSLAA